MAKKYVNENYGSFAEVCHLFLKEANLNGEVPVAAVLACAGPVLNNTVVFTNIAFGWSIDGAGLQKELGITTVKLINDFAAMGYGLLTLKPHEYIVLNDVPKEEGAPIATIGAGTGLGECFLTAGIDGQYSCFASEGGHTDFAPADELEIEIYNAMKKDLSCPKRLSVERIVSGPGLAHVFDFLCKKFPQKVNPKVKAEFDNAKTLQGKVIGEYAKTDELCNKAMEIFVGYVDKLSCEKVTDSIVIAVRMVVKQVMRCSSTSHVVDSTSLEVLPQRTWITLPNVQSLQMLCLTRDVYRLRLKQYLSILY